METDVNTDQIVADSGVVQAASATEPVIDAGQPVPGEGVPTTEGVPQQQAVAPTEQQVEQKGPVPYERFAEVNSKANTAAAENAQLKEHISLLSNQQPTQQQQQPVQQVQEGLTSQVMKQLGIDEDYATPVQMAQVIDTVANIRATQTATQTQNAQFMATHADFAQVVGGNDPVTGQFTYAPPLLRAIQLNPQLMTDLQAAGTGANRLAYQIAVSDPTYQTQLAQANKPAPQLQAEAAEAAINSAQSMTSISAVGSGGVIDKAAELRNMSDADFAAHKQAVIQQGGVSSY